MEVEHFEMTPHPMPWELRRSYGCKPKGALQGALFNEIHHSKKIKA
jgi:hypothetical protein